MSSKHEAPRPLPPSESEAELGKDEIASVLKEELAKKAGTSSENVVGADHRVAATPEDIAAMGDMEIDLDGNKSITELLNPRPTGRELDELLERPEEVPASTPEGEAKAEKVESPSAEAGVTEAEIGAEMSPENQGVFRKMSAGGKKIMKQAAESWHENSVKIYEGSMGMADRTFRASDNVLEKGKKVAGKIYDGLYKIPGVKRVLGKMEIAYNQMFINRHEGRAVGFRERMDSTTKELEIWAGQKERIKGVIEDLKRKGISTESMQLEIKKIERQEVKLMHAKNRDQDRVEKREEKSKLYTNRRDAVADKLINSYNEKIRPIDGKLEALQTGRDRVELQLAIMEAKHKEEAASLDEIKKQKEEMEDTYRMLNWDEKKISKNGVIRMLEKQLADGYGKMKTERGEIVRKMNKIDERISKLDKKANPARSRREDLIRIKEGRPIKFDVEERKGLADLTDRETATIHTREGEPREETDDEVESEESSAAEAEAEAEAEESREKVENWTMKELLESWNNHLDEKYKKEAVSEKIDPKEFFKVMENMGSSQNAKVDGESFESILRTYCKFKKMPISKLNESIGAFLRDKMADEE